MAEDISRQNPILSDSRDSRSFIFRLPIEILETIFIHCVSDSHSKNCGGCTTTVPGWVNVSYVCRHWRNVALNCSNFWTYLSITSPRWTEELLVRSKQAPLKLQVHSSHWDKMSRVQCFLEQVMHHVERIQELYLHPRCFVNDYTFFSKLSSRAPRLRHLEISTTSFSSDWSSILFDGDTPALRTLELKNCPLPWYSFKLHGLTALTLYHVPDQFQQDTAAFLTTLSCMQDLRHLYLDRALASAAGFLFSATFNTFQKVDLPHLRRLLIAAPLSTVIALLSCVNTPSNAELRLQCLHDDDSRLNDYALLSSLLAPRLGVSEDQTTIRSLVVQLNPGTEALTFSASERDYDSYASSSLLEWSHDIPLHIILHFSGTRLITNHICRPISLTNVRSVHITRPPSTSAFWSEILECLPNLRYLKLSRGYMPDPACLFSHIPAVGGENGAEHANRRPIRVLAPALQELELCDISFSARSLDSDRIDPYVVDVQSLYDALSSCKDTRGQLTMTRCRVEMGYDNYTQLDIVGRWEDGQFHVIERT